MKFEACYQDLKNYTWEQYTIEAIDEATARKQAERIAKMEDKVLMIFSRKERCDYESERVNFVRRS